MRSPLNGMILIACAIALVLLSYARAQGDSNHRTHFYETKRYNNTSTIVHYKSFGRPWIDQDPRLFWNHCCCQTAPPRINMIRVDGKPRIYREVIWIHEVWTVDRIDPLRSE